MGGIIIDTKGSIKAVGKKVTNGNLPSSAEKIDLKKQILIPGIVDMRVFVGEPGFEYKETINTGALAAFYGGYTRVCLMPNTNPVIDSPELVKYVINKSFEIFISIMVCR